MRSMRVTSLTSPEAGGMETSADMVSGCAVEVLSCCCNHTRGGGVGLWMS